MREHILIVQLGLGTSFPLSLGRNQSRRTISNTGGGGGQFPLSLAFPFLTSSIILILLLLTLIEFVFACDACSEVIILTEHDSEEVDDDKDEDIVGTASSVK